MLLKIKEEKAQKCFTFDNYKNCCEATQIENKINYLEKKNEINVYRIYKKFFQKEFIKNNKLILKTQQRFKFERNNVFTKIDLSSNDDKKM